MLVEVGLALVEVGLALLEVVEFALAGGELVEPEAGLGLVGAVVGQGAKRNDKQKGR